ncbi:hypothetical protein HDU85_003548 [Gaertneriomyces sp. JEL0708]|nr:hypothetical protein HDU85_003548 [Gaertneriomyces sp. JEL0708]
MPQVELVAELPGHTDRVWSISWHPTLPLFASCSGDKSVRIWKKDDNGTAWNCVSVLDDAHKRTIRSCAFSADGKFLATASFDASTAVWERMEDGEWECVATLEGHENEVKCVAWSASGALLSTCSRDKSVWVWEVIGDGDFECLSVLQEHEQDVKMVQWHPNEELIASASYDDTIKIWREDDDDWYCSDTLKGHTSTVWGIDFDASGNHLVSVSDDRSVKIWERINVPNTGNAFSFRNDPKWQCISTLSDCHSRTIYAVSWSKIHGCIATAGADCTVQLIQKTPNGFEVTATLPNPHGTADVNCVRWCPLESYSNLLATAGDDNTVRIWRCL